MSPTEVRRMTDSEIIEMLVSLRPSDEAVAWLAAVIADPARTAGVAELSRRYAAHRDGRIGLPRARSAGTVSLDSIKFKNFMWSRRITMTEVGLMIGRSDGLGSCIASRGRTSYWTADAIATELGMTPEAFLAQVGTEEEVARLACCV